MIMITTDTGQVYYGYFQNHGKNESTSCGVSFTKSSNKVEVLSSNEGLTLDQVLRRSKKSKLKQEEVNLEQVSLLYRGLRCFCDPKSKNYAVIQYDPRME